VCDVKNWRDIVLESFKEPLFHLMLVSDPDGLLADEVIISSLQDKGIEIVKYKDHATFRYLYERYYRDHLHDKYLLVHLDEKSFDHLPYDLLQEGHQIELKVSKLFPHFSTSIVQQLDSHTLDALYPASKQVQGSLSTQETIDFVLRKVFKLAYDTVDNKEEFIRLLVEKHESILYMPAVLEDFLYDYFRNASFLQQISVKKLITSRTSFYEYLQNEWKTFIKSLNESYGISRETHDNNFYHQHHPFESKDMQYMLNRLFAEGKIQPVSDVDIRRLPKWTHQGVNADRLEDTKKRVGILVQQLEEKLNERLTYKQWLEIIQLYSESKYLNDKFGLNITEVTDIELTMEMKFESWMLKEYRALSSLPYFHAPVMSHHIPHFLRIQESKKKAIIVLDGMSFIQWKQIRSYLNDLYQYEEHGVFAWVPTITSVSRQSIFTGEIPFYFADTINTTRKEPSAWQLFWEQQSISKLHITYEKGLGQGTYHRENINALQRSNTKIAGIVIDTIDRFMHGAIQGHRGMIAEIDVWLKNGYLYQLIKDLIQAGFDIYLTSDHGNKESIGTGRINEGVLAETRGERVRIYKNESLRNQAAINYSSISWPNIGLSRDRYMLMARSGEAFINKGEQVVSHGGISIEEVIVPFIHITPKSDIQ
jgi:hypothetical protein